jgi:LPXTG-motif cell wall-anchored protein
MTMSRRLIPARTSQKESFMHTKHLLTLAVLGAALLPISGARAQDNTSSMSSMSTSDPAEFRGNLHRLHDLFSDMRENSQLAVATPDAMVASSYSQMNRRLLQDSLGVLDELTVNWKRIDTPETNVQQLGSKDMARFAGESEDTAFVRNTVWDLQSRLLAAKLNGRDTGIVTSEMMSMLDAAIARAENPNFRVASASSSSSMHLSEINWGRTEESASAPAGETVAQAPTTREWHEVTIEHENLPARDRVAMADTTTTTESVTTTTESNERMGAANLPQTGGDPGLLYMFGSGMMGLGGLLLRRKRS